MAGLRYPLMYQCKRCEEVYEGLHRSKIHVKEEHGIAWKRTRKELRIVGIHEQLPTSIVGESRKSLKTRLIEVFAYKGYLKDLPVFGSLKLDQSGKSGGE